MRLPEKLPVYAKWVVVWLVCICGSLAAPAAFCGVFWLSGYLTHPARRSRSVAFLPLWYSFTMLLAKVLYMAFILPAWLHRTDVYPNVTTPLPVGRGFSLHKLQPSV